MLKKFYKFYATDVTFTDEELSRILSAHCAGLLRNYGADNFSFCLTIGGCINQIAYNCPQRLEAAGLNMASRWFDHYYDASMTVDELIKELIGIGAIES